ncbi:MAG: hypothetical protein ACRD3O_18145 [Terriglobia bacterium]
MDFIERIFHVAPDGGSGALELAIMLVFLIVPLAVVVLRKRRAWSSSWSRALQGVTKNSGVCRKISKAQTRAMPLRHAYCWFRVYRHRVGKNALN